MSLDVNGYNETFNSFVKFAQQRISANDSKAVADATTQKQIEDPKSLSISKSSSDEVHKWKRTGDERKANNHTRELFKAAVIDMFGGEAKIPASVKKAMLLVDYDQGKPLTARRIMAVKNAIDLDGTSKAHAEREATTANHLKAEPGSHEAMLAAVGGRFTANETSFAKGMALFDNLRQFSRILSVAERDRIFQNFYMTLEYTEPQMNAAMYRIALESVAFNDAADLDAGDELFTAANNPCVRLATLEFSGPSAIATAMALQPNQRAALARILCRFMDQFPPQARQDGRVVVQEDFVLRLAKNIDRLSLLDAAGKLNAKALVKTCYPESKKPGSFDVGNAIFADVEIMEANRTFKNQVAAGRFYKLGDFAYTSVMESAATALHERLGDAFVPKEFNLMKMIIGKSLSNDIEGLVNTAIAQNRMVEPDEFGEVAAESLFRAAVQNRMGKVMEQLGQAKNVVQPGNSMASMLLTRRPELYEGFRAAKTPAEADAALEAIREAMEEAVERQHAMESLVPQMINMAATLFVDTLDMPLDKVKEKVKFVDRVTNKIRDMTADIQKGVYPGSLEPNFDPKQAFENLTRKIADEYLNKLAEIDALEGQSEEVKTIWKRDVCTDEKPSWINMAKIVRLSERIDITEMSNKLADPNATDKEKIAAIKRFCDNLETAGVSTFENWGRLGPDEKNTAVMLALRPAFVKTPAFLPMLAQMVRNENNLLLQALPEVGERQYVLVNLHNMAMEA